MGTGGVLIVEDDDSIREVLTELLEDVGYVVFIAHNGRVALERLRSHPEGLVVLLDLIMPDMDGYCLLQVIADESSLATKHAYSYVCHGYHASSACGPACQSNSR